MATDRIPDQLRAEAGEPGEYVSIDSALLLAAADQIEHATTLIEAMLAAQGAPTIRDIVDADLKPTLDAAAERQRAWAGPLEEMVRMTLDPIPAPFRHLDIDPDVWLAALDAEVEANPTCPTCGWHRGRYIGNGRDLTPGTPTAHPEPCAACTTWRDAGRTR